MKLTRLILSETVSACSGIQRSSENLSLSACDHFADAVLLRSISEIASANFFMMSFEERLKIKSFRSDHSRPERNVKSFFKFFSKPPKRLKKIRN